jgi:hypothetical protein
LEQLCFKIGDPALKACVGIPVGAGTQPKTENQEEDKPSLNT